MPKFLAETALGECDETHSSSNTFGCSGLSKNLLQMLHPQRWTNGSTASWPNTSQNDWANRPLIASEMPKISWDNHNFFLENLWALNPHIGTYSTHGPPGAVEKHLMHARTQWPCTQWPRASGCTNRGLREGQSFDVPPFTYRRRCPKGVLLSREMLCMSFASAKVASICLSVL